MTSLPKAHPSEWKGGKPAGVNGRVAGSAAIPDRRLVTRPAADIAAEAVRWLWPDRIPFGMLTEILGDPGCGKSTITAALAAAVSRGRGFPPGYASGRAGGVLFLSAEDSASHTIRPRLEAAGADLARVHVLDHVEAGGRKFALTLPDHFDLIRAAADSHAATLIVMDPLNAFLSPKVDGNTDQDVRSQIMYPLKELAEATGAAVVLVRHLNKGSGTRAIYRGGGSIGYTGSVRVSLAAGKAADGRRYLCCNKSNVGPEPRAVEYTLEHGEDGGPACVAWGEESDMDADALFAPPAGGCTRPDRTEQAVAFLRDRLAGGPVDANTLKAESIEAGLSYSTLRRAKDHIGAKVKKCGYQGVWKWELPADANLPAAEGIPTL